MGSGAKANASLRVFMCERAYERASPAVGKPLDFFNEEAGRMRSAAVEFATQS